MTPIDWEQSSATVVTGGGSPVYLPDDVKERILEQYPELLETILEHELSDKPLTERSDDLARAIMATLGIKLGV